MNNPNDESRPNRHLFIAGTGRAGTSFLVRYLSALGMDTTLSRRGESAGWDERAKAGLEQMPTELFGPNVPYVVKSPWLHLVVDELIVKAKGSIDGLIVPIRDLSEAASSRVSVERAAMHEADGVWMDKLDQPWDVRATTPGGVIYSLDVVDQARLLAVGFHHLIQRFVAADLPIVFLAFPRTVTDPEYLYSKLRRYMPPETTESDANMAFAETANASFVHQFESSPRA